ncbi:helix-turn-helix domain-containing protein [Amycolatopsis sp. NPDC059657]|uniref:helix-turn-helix domain-containing protein n=1 Tax=Amycolatopsis sp. NPDC059657 TaxID=3346899 RepID=UPI003670170D
MKDDATTEPDRPAAKLLATRIQQLRRDAGLSQPELAARIGYSRQYVSMAERKVANLPSRGLVSALDSALDAAGELLNLREAALAEQKRLRTNDTATNLPVLDSAAVTPTAAQVTVGLDPYSAIELDVSPVEYLAQTSVETPVPQQIGWTDVEHVRTTTRAIAMSENLFGGGLSCDAALGQLRWAGRLLEARATNEVRDAMSEAVGNLSSVVAHSAFDIANYDAADRCFRFSLWCARQGNSWSLRANTLAELARMVIYLGDLDKALSLIEFAQVRSDRIPATARAMLSALRARILALTDRTAEAVSEVDRADSHFADRDPAGDPPWLCYYDEAEHQGSTGKALIPVAHQNKHAELAAVRLRNAIELHGSTYPRSRTFSRTRLAALLMTTGDPHEGLDVGRQAVVEAAPIRSQRLTAELRTLAHVSEQHESIGDVAELRRDITLLAGAQT